MKKLLFCCCAALFAANASAQPAYEPSPENLAARQRFADGRFGIFLHWGLYALLGQGEWVMTNQDIDYREYEKLAGAFCPAAFDAKAWVTAFREAGARYVCFDAPPRRILRCSARTVALQRRGRHAVRTRRGEGAGRRVPPPAGSGHPLLLFAHRLVGRTPARPLRGAARDVRPKRRMRRPISTS